MNRGAAGQELYRTPRDYEFFMRTMAIARDKFNLRIHAYCLMPNHFHFLIQVGSVPVSSAMHFVETRYAIYFNQHHERWGHVFHGRFKALNCWNESYYRNLVRYIHLNPRHAGLASDPGAWAWSSHRDLIAADNSFITASATLGHFGADKTGARAAYLNFLTQNSDVADIEISRNIFQSLDELHRYDPRVTGLLSKLINGLKEEYGSTRTRASREKFISAARNLGIPMSAVAEHLGISRAALYKTAAS